MAQQTASLMSDEAQIDTIETEVARKKGMLDVAKEIRLELILKQGVNPATNEPLSSNLELNAVLEEFMPDGLTPSDSARVTELRKRLTIRANHPSNSRR